MSMRGGKKINGRWFTETHSSGAVRYTRRCFIDGRLVSRKVWLAEIEAGRAVERAEADAACERMNREGGPALLRAMFRMEG